MKKFYQHLRRLALYQRIHRARRAFRHNYSEWKKTGSGAARLNVLILDARLRRLEGHPA